MPFTDEKIQQVWEKGEVVENYDRNTWRKDAAQAWIRRNHYGNRDSQYGWEIDHIHPESEGGVDELSNLRPLQWKNNAAKQAGRIKHAVTSSGNQNIDVE